MGRGRPVRALVALAAAGLLITADAPAAPAPLGPLSAEDHAVLAGDTALAVREAGARGEVVELPGGRVVHRYDVLSEGYRPGRIAASATTAALVVANPRTPDSRGAFQVFAGPPPGPLTPLGPSQAPRRGTFMPEYAEVDGDRVFLREAPFGSGAERISVVEPGAAPRPLDLPVSTASAMTFAGDLVAYATRSRPSRRVDEAEADRLVVADWRTGTERWRADLGGHADRLDLRADGRVVAELVDEDIVEVVPGGGAVRMLARAGSGARFAGDAIVYLRRGRRASADDRVMLVAPGGSPRPIGVPSTEITGLGADERRVVWQANGCLLAAALTDGPAAAPAPGPCPRSEAVLHRGPQRPISPRTRRVPFVLRCVAAPAPGCRGTVRLESEFGGARRRTAVQRFAIPAGARRQLSARLTPRQFRLARVYAQVGLGGVPFAVRTVTTDPQGRASTATAEVIADIRPKRR